MSITLPAGQRVRVTEFGETPEEALEKFVRLETQPAPDPAALQAHEVLVAVRSAAIAWVDLLMTSGQYQHMAQPPYTPGMEYTGEVIAVGAGVDPAQCAVGERVMADMMRVGPRASRSYQSAGGLATYVTLPLDGLFKLPEYLSFDEGAVFLQAYETAYHCIVARGQVQAGESVLIHGASGLTGLAAVQVAKLMGATVIATGRSDAKLAQVRQMGADHVINISRPEGSLREFRDEVKALTGGQGVDVVYDAVGGQVSLESLRCMAFEGRFLSALEGRGHGWLRGSPMRGVRAVWDRGRLDVITPRLRRVTAHLLLDLGA